MPERCIDASVAVKWVIAGEPWRRKARELLRDSIAARFELIAPPLFAYETESVIQFLLTTGSLSVSDADLALKRLATAGINIVSHPELVTRARAIARRFHQPRIYDSVYAALGEVRGCEFWTADRQFFDVVKTSLPFVKYLPSYP